MLVNPYMRAALRKRMVLSRTSQGLLLPATVRQVEVMIQWISRPITAVMVNGIHQARNPGRWLWFTTASQLDPLSSGTSPMTRNGGTSRSTSADESARKLLREPDRIETAIRSVVPVTTG
jgi:hypothetical protein